VFYGLVRDSAVIGTARYAYGKAKRTSAKRTSAKRAVPRTSANPVGRPLWTTEPVVWVED
jgi:hypothetical protein